MARNVVVVEHPFFKEIKDTNPTVAFMPEKKTVCLTITLPTKIEVLDYETGEPVNTKVSLKRYLLVRNGGEGNNNLVAFCNYDSPIIFGLGLLPRDESFMIPPQISPEAVSVIKETGKLTTDPDVQGIFNTLVSLLDSFFEFANPIDRELIACWVIGTYFYKMFDSFPYLFITGMKRVGKTKLLRFLELTCFNARMSSDLTASSMFRLISDWGCVLLMDEEENLSNPERKTDFRSMLLAGYKKGGGVFRTEGEGKKKPVSYETYSPKALANISGLEDVLLDRTITIVLPRSVNKQIANTRITDGPIWTQVKDQLYMLLLSRYDEIYQVKEAFQDPGDLVGRDYELWYPILVIAKWISEELYQRMHQYALDKTEEKNIIEKNENRDLLLLQSLVLNVKEDDEYSISKIKEWMLPLIPEGENKWLNSVWIAKSLRRIGFKDSVKISKAGGRHYYTLKVEDVKEKARKMGLTIPGEQSSTPPREESSVSNGQALNEQRD